jgi:hypothetical protein
MGSHCLDNVEKFKGCVIIASGSLGYSRNCLYADKQYILDETSCDKYADVNIGIVDVNSSLSKIYNSNLLGGLKVGYSRMKMSDSVPAFIVFEGSGNEYPTGEIYWSNVLYVDETGKVVAGPIEMENTHISEMTRTTCGEFSAKGSRIFGHNVVTTDVTLDDCSYIMDGSSAVGKMNITNSLFKSHYFSTQDIILKDKSIAEVNHFHPINITVSNKSVLDVIYGNIDNSMTLEKGKLTLTDSMFSGKYITVKDINSALSFVDMYSGTIEGMTLLVKSRFEAYQTTTLTMSMESSTARFIDSRTGNILCVDTPNTIDGYNSGFGNLFSQRPGDKVGIAHLYNSVGLEGAAIRLYEESSLRLIPYPRENHSSGTSKYFVDCSLDVTTARDYVKLVSGSDFKIWGGSRVEILSVTNKFYQDQISSGNWASEFADLYLHAYHHGFLSSGCYTHVGVEPNPRFSVGHAEYNTTTIVADVVQMNMVLAQHCRWH